MNMNSPLAMFSVSFVVTAFLMMIVYTGAGGYYFGTNAARDRPDPVTAPAAVETSEAPAEETPDEEPVTSESTEVAEAPEDAPAEPVQTASAFPDLAGDAANGRTVWRQCSACHVAERPDNRVGPHLVGLLGRDIGSIEGFRYSDVLLDMGGQWTPEELDAWLENPQAYAPGTKMAYRGIADPEDRQDVIKYLSQY